MKHLYETDIIFVDLDETLFHTYAKILVIDTKTGKLKKALSNSEFNNYELNENEEFDFSQFKSSDIFENSKPIRKIIDFISEISQYKEVAILTARSDFIDKDKFISILKKHGLDVGHYKDKKIHVIRCGNLNEKSSSKAKVKMIKKILKKRPGVKKISIIDDCAKNLNAIKKIKNVDVALYIVKDDDKISKFTSDNWNS